VLLIIEGETFQSGADEGCGSLIVFYVLPGAMIEADVAGDPEATCSVGDGASYTAGEGVVFFDQVLAVE